VAWLIRGTNLVRVDLACSKFWAVCGRKVGVAIAHGCFGRFVGVMWAWHPADLGGLWALEGRGTVPKHTLQIITNESKAKESNESQPAQLL